MAGQTGTDLSPRAPSSVSSRKNRGDLTEVTARGHEMEPRTWVTGNTLHISEHCPRCEQRILRLPAGVGSADTALERHLTAIWDSTVACSEGGPFVPR